ncbi:MAG TPA: hypothetical protein VJL90_01255 [Pseudorhodoplanes sp.]|nr:hypothetical protein [Pseudorhodoplanes sp.]
MGPLTVFCPRSGRPINSGIKTDWSTILRLRPLTVRVACPECGEHHDVHLKDGYLARAELGENDPSVAHSPRLEHLLRMAEASGR